MGVTLSREEIDAAFARKEALYAATKTQECSVCSGRMDIRMVAGEPVLGCPADWSHAGYRKRRSLTQLVKDGDAVDPFVSERLEREKKKK